MLYTKIPHQTHDCYYFPSCFRSWCQGIEDLKNQIEDETIPSKAFPYQIAFNLIPQIGDFDDLGISKEEWKMQNEARKMWHDEELK